VFFTFSALLYELKFLSLFIAIATCPSADSAPTVMNLTETESEPSHTMDTRDDKEIFIAVTVKDRISYVKLFAEHANWLNISDLADVHVFDNGSRQFSIMDLQSWFPCATIHEMDTLHDADIVTRRAFEFFISNSSCRTLINVDSDALLHPEWQNFVRKVLPHSDGAISLYHSAAPYHPSSNCNEITCEKKTIGALGMVFRREVLQEALSEVQASKTKEKDSFDWALCAYLIKSGRKVLVPRQSLVLHFGLHGAHGDGSSHVEVDKDFNMSSLPTTTRAQVRYFTENKFVSE